MRNSRIKISYDKESRVISLRLIDGARPVDSDIHGNVVIDYDKNDNVVQIDFYDFNFNDFKRSVKNLRGLRDLVVVQ